MSRAVSEVTLIVGEGCELSPRAEVGVRPERSIPDLVLRIGDRARIRSGSVLYAGSTIGADLNIGHSVVIREENAIGDRVSIWGNSTIDYGCRIGCDVKIHTGVYVAQFTVIEDGVFIAPGVVLANDPHPGCERAKDCMRGPTIRHGARIGVNATILPFVEIGAGALVGAGAVVTRSVPPGMVVVGNPARVVRPTSELRCLIDPPLVPAPYPTPPDGSQEK
jgi:acetyltransferase-like isoleucine patch superfamily enzyme